MKGLYSIATLLSIISIVAGDSRIEYTPFDKSKLTKSSFFEQFDYDDLSSSNWIPTNARKDAESSYRGKWSIETSVIYPGFDNDKGLVMKTPAAHHAISYKFDTPFDNTNKTLVLQYELKLQDSMTCGGAYIKLLNEGFDPLEFNGSTPYQVMFGPDQCGSENKVHFIINRKNPITGEYEEKHLRTTPMSRIDQVSNLYTLIFKKNLDFEIRINGEVAKAGNFLKSPHLLTPALNPPKEIEDVKDHKPFDWVEEEYIDDPDAPLKPDDWDEKFGRTTIRDPDAVKPEDWDEEEPPFIPDPNALKPEDWDDDEDGDWVAPEIPNPKCETHGCGKWEAPWISNVNYKGPWQQQRIPNPKYKGEWKPRKIINPQYYEDTIPSNIESVGGLGFELWTMNKDIMFDNIYLGHSIKDAELIGNQTFNPKYILEWDSYDNYKPRAEHEPVPPPKSFEDFLNDDNVSTFAQFTEFIRLLVLRQYLDISDFYYQFLANPIGTIAGQPLKFVVYCCVFLTIFTFGFAILNVIVFIISGPPPSEKPTEVREEPPKIEEIVEEPKATGVRPSGKATRRR